MGFGDGEGEVVRGELGRAAFQLEVDEAELYRAEPVDGDVPVHLDAVEGSVHSHGGCARPAEVDWAECERQCGCAFGESQCGA